MEKTGLITIANSRAGIGPGRGKTPKGIYEGRLFDKVSLRRSDNVGKRRFFDALPFETNR